MFADVFGIGDDTIQFYFLLLDVVDDFQDSLGEGIPRDEFLPGFFVVFAFRECRLTRGIKDGIGLFRDYQER